MSQGIVRANARNAMTTDSWVPFIEVGGQVVWEGQRIYESGPDARAAAEGRLEAALSELFHENNSIYQIEQRLRNVEHKLQQVYDQVNGGM